MAIILPQLQRQPDAFEQLQTGLGSGISAGLQQLAKMKMDEVLGQKEYQTLANLLGKPLNQPNPNMGVDGTGEQQAPISGSLPSTGYIKPGKALEYAKFGADQEYRKKKLAVEERKQEFAEQEKVQPYLQAKAQDFQNAKNLYNAANKALKLLDEHENDWPGISGLLPEQLQPIVQRNPYVREYMTLTDEIATLLANSRKGQPTNFKTKLELRSKANISQPIDTQRQRLKKIIEDSKNEFQVNKEIQNLNKQYGKYPRDLATKLTEFELGQLEGKENKKEIDQNESLIDLLGEPANYSEDTEIQVGKKKVGIKNNNWIYL